MIVDVPANFTLQELQAYLAGEMERGAPPGFRTTREWAEMFKTDPRTMLEVFKQAQANEMLLVDWVRMERIDGVMQKRPVYAFILPEQGEVSNLSGDS